MTRLNRRQTLSLLGAGVAASSLAMPAIAQNRKVAVGALHLTSHSGSFIALERNYFKDAGLDVELKFFQAAQPMAVAIASGDVDYGVTAITGGLISLAQKGAVKVFGGALSERPGINGQKILASNKAFEAGLKTPKDLGGKRIGMTTAGSSFQYMCSRISQKEGVKADFVPLQKVGAIIGALKSGQIDAWSIVPHIAVALEGAGAAHIIGNVGDYLPHYQVTTLFTSLANTTDNRSQTEAFLQGYSKGVSDYDNVMVYKKDGEEALNEMVKLIHKYVYADKPLEKAAKSIVAGSMALNPGGELNLKSVQDQLDWFISEKLIDSDISLDTLVDKSFAKMIVE